MWTLFTTALARASSTTQVSIINTSSNFVITAILGLAIFSESLPPLWWLGAAMLVAGNVIVGRKDEGVPTEQGTADEGEPARSAVGTESGSGPVEPASGGPAERVRPEGKDKDDDEDVADIGEQ